MKYKEGIAQRWKCSRSRKKNPWQRLPIGNRFHWPFHLGRAAVLEVAAIGGSEARPRLNYRFRARVDNR